MKYVSVLLFLAALLVGTCAYAASQSTAFTYQGHLLQNGTPTSGSHNLTFTLWDSASGGARVGPAITQAGYPVANGVFTIDLDFGTNAFTGPQRWLDVSVDGNELTPRQPVNSMPVAQFALSAQNGMSVTGTTTSNQFTNDHLYTGVSVNGQNLPMVMQASPAFSPAGTSAQPVYTNAVDVFSLTSAIANTVSVGGSGGAGAGKASATDVRMLVALDPAYPGIATKLFTGAHYDNLQIDVLQTANSKPILQSFCYGIVFVSSLQPMPQAGVYEMTIAVGQIGSRVAQVSAGTVNGYVESGWSFITNAAVATPCVNPTPP
jgi:hypothetical protein